jgi:hypothetical protein
VRGEEVDRAVRRIETRRPDLNMAVQSVAGGLTAGEGVDMIHQAALRRFLWWHLPRDYPEDEWHGLVEPTALLLDELGLKHLADLARSSETEKVLAVWRQGREKGRRLPLRTREVRSRAARHDTPRLGVDHGRGRSTRPRHR